MFQNNDNASINKIKRQILKIPNNKYQIFFEK